MDRTIWGELESESEEEESEEEESEAEEESEDQTGLVTPAEGLVTPSGMASIPTGLETPEIIELRKRKIENEMDGYVIRRYLTSLYLFVNELTCFSLLQRRHTCPALPGLARKTR